MIAITLITLTQTLYALCVRDDQNHKIILNKPATRIISLAPSFTHLLTTIGANHHIIGVDSFSHSLPIAQDKTVVGDYAQLNLEKIAALNPDLIIVWYPSNITYQLQQLRFLNIPIFYSNPHSIPEIAKTMRQFGKLTGHSKKAKQQATQLLQRYQALKQQYASQPPLRVFYQIWDHPLMTVGNKSFINQAIKTCGGRNIYQAIAKPAFAVTPESVIMQSPQVIITDKHAKNGLQQWSSIPAVKKQMIYHIPAQLLAEPDSQLIQGIAMLCQDLQQARHRMRER